MKAVKPYAVGRFYAPAARSYWLKALARTWRVSIRDIAGRMGLTQKRVREVLNGKAYGGRLPYFEACEFIEGITGNARVFSPVYNARLQAAQEERIAA